MTLQPGAYDPRFMKPATLCRCGHILECCADCMGWLRENSTRIAASWRWWTSRAPGSSWYDGWAHGANEAEADDLAYYQITRPMGEA